jgi:hypothetical protein
VHNTKSGNEPDFVNARSTELEPATFRVTGGTGGTVFLEIAFGDFDENDITRLEDCYGRA